tara:strand:+ start:182 stop:469 length:288 start_codon:yes stop_codon:yes gene_type:complete
MKNAIIVILIIVGILSQVRLVDKPTDQINTLEDLKEWIQWDIEENRIDIWIGNSYLEAIDYELNKYYGTKEMEGQLIHLLFINKSFHIRRHNGKN